jgi:hypothetical protein
MRKFGFALLVAISVASSARATWVNFDQEPLNNNGPAGGELLVSDIPVVNARFAACSPAADIGLGSLAAGGGDVDYYSIFLPAGCNLTAITTPYGAQFSAPDTVMAIFAPGGAQLTFNDDSGASPEDWAGGVNTTVRGSAGRVLTPVAGIYTIGVAGFDATVSGPYALTVSVFPEPATIGMLLAGVVLVARRRR